MLDDLIVEAEKIKNTRWNSPLKNIFAAKASRYVENNFGPEYGRVITNAMKVGLIRRNEDSWNQRRHAEIIQNTIEILEQLKSEKKRR